jgi:hypothetical protein
MDNWGGGIRQLINILFCGYRSDIHYRRKMRAETYTRLQRLKIYRIFLPEIYKCVIFMNVVRLNECGIALKKKAL